MSVFPWIWSVLVESFHGIARTVGLLLAIVIPLMIALEVLKEAKILERLARRAEPVAGRLGLSGRATFPFLAGLVFGLAYGAGVIIESAREGELSQADRRLLCIFLVACHAIFEDTLLFVPFGVNPALLLGTRLTLAVAITAAAARFVRSRAEGLEQ